MTTAKFVFRIPCCRGRRGVSRQARFCDDPYRRDAGRRRRLVLRHPRGRAERQVVPQNGRVPPTGRPLAQVQGVFSGTFQCLLQQCPSPINCCGQLDCSTRQPHARKICPKLKFCLSMTIHSSSCPVFLVRSNKMDFFQLNSPFWRRWICGDGRGPTWSCLV